VFPPLTPFGSLPVLYDRERGHVAAVTGGLACRTNSSGEILPRKLLRMNCGPSDRSRRSSDAFRVNDRILNRVQDDISLARMCISLDRWSISLVRTGLYAQDDRHASL
jgi:hypothetical protein